MATYPNTTHYSEHFKRSELDCNCGCKTPPEIEKNLIKLAGLLEELRRLAGRGLSPNCGYRCPAHNATLPGAAKASYHMKGLAADIDCSAGGRREVDRLAKLASRITAFRVAGIGVYYEGHGLFVHVDFAPRFWRGVNGR